MTDNIQSWLYHNCSEENCVQGNFATSWPRAWKCAWTNYALPALVSVLKEYSIHKLRQVKKRTTGETRESGTSTSTTEYCLILSNNFKKAGQIRIEEGVNSGPLHGSEGRRVSFHPNPPNRHCKLSNPTSAIANYESENRHCESESSHCKSEIQHWCDGIFSCLFIHSQASILAH